MTSDLTQAAWFKSSYSGDKADCVEVAFLAEGCVGVRDSKNPGPALVFADSEWVEFVAELSGRGDAPRP